MSTYSLSQFKVYIKHQIADIYYSLKPKTSTYLPLHCHRMESLTREIKVEVLGFKCDFIDLSDQSSYCFYHIYCYIYDIQIIDIVIQYAFKHLKILIKFINGCLLKYRVINRWNLLQFNCTFLIIGDRNRLLCFITRSWTFDNSSDWTR